MWQWWNHCLAKVPPGTTALRINLDETSVCLFQGDAKGHVFANKRQHPDGYAQRAPRSKRRSCLTHVGIICDRLDLQPLLPQVVIGNERTFPKACFAELQAACPPNVVLIRQRSAWNDKGLCSNIVHRLGAALKDRIDGLQPILLLDAVRLRTAPKVLSAGAKWRIWPVVVPAKMTWLLQPLDTSAFQAYKAYLTKSYQRARAASPTGDVSISGFLHCVYDAARHTLQGKSWSLAFDRAGFSPSQAKLSEFVKRQLQIEQPVEIGAGRPTEEQLRGCFPARAAIPVVALFKPLERSAILLALAGPAPGSLMGSGAAVALQCNQGPVVAPRTRAQRRRAEAEAARASSESVAPAASSSSAPVLGRTRSESRLLQSRPPVPPSSLHH